MCWILNRKTKTYIIWSREGTQVHIPGYEQKLNNSFKRFWFTIVCSYFIQQPNVALWVRLHMHAAWNWDVFLVSGHCDFFCHGSAWSCLFFAKYAGVRDERRGGWMGVFWLLGGKVDMVSLPSEAGCRNASLPSVFTAFPSASLLVLQSWQKLHMLFRWRWLQPSCSLHPSKRWIQQEIQWIPTPVFFLLSLSLLFSVKWKKNLRYLFLLWHPPQKAVERCVPKGEKTKNSISP